MKIEWASHFRPDGRRRQPPPSTIHGWLAKWRGTFMGSEHVRNKGMAEMRKASAYRKARKRYEQKKAGKQGGSGILSLFRCIKPLAGRRPARRSTRTRTWPARPSHSRSKKLANTGHHLTTSRQLNPNLKPRANSQKRPTCTHPPARRGTSARRPTGRR